MGKPNCKNIKRDGVHKRASRKRTIRECLSGNARQAIGDITPGCEIFGFTKGQFSMMDLIIAILEQTGPATVDLSTWTAANADIRHCYQMLESGKVTASRWVVDVPFPNRQREYFAALVERFGPESIRLTRTHAKFVLIRNDRWNICVRSSMNLNKNPRFENFEISDDPDMAAFFGEIVDEIFESPEVGERPSTPEIDATFKSMEFRGESYDASLYDFRPQEL